MERVTQKNERGYYLLGDGIYSDWGVPEKFRGDDVDRLAAYEDTGLEPEEIAKIKQDVEDGYMKSTARRYGIDVPRLRELAQADREGGGRGAASRKAISRLKKRISLARGTRPTGGL